MHIAIINLSTEVLQSVAATMTRAVGYQLREHWAPFWERMSPGVSLETMESLQLGMARIYLVDSVDQMNTLGFHTKDPLGQYYGRVFVNTILGNGGSVLFGGPGIDTVSAALSHEAIELATDANVATWVDGPQIVQGNQYAYEPCDPVQQDFYATTDGKQGVMLSNFVLPAWYEERSAGPYDFLTKLQAPFSLSQGGYMIVRAGQNEEKVVSLAADRHQKLWKMAGKAMMGARTLRRMEKK